MCSGSSRNFKQQPIDAADETVSVMMEVDTQIQRDGVAKRDFCNFGWQFFRFGIAVLPIRTGITGILRSNAYAISSRTKSDGSSMRRFFCRPVRPSQSGPINARSTFD